MTRGALLVAIAWAHGLLLLEPGHARFVEVARHLLSGTVGFTTISGWLVGWFVETRGETYARIVARYRRQTVRLLLIAHPLLVLALYLPAHAALADFALRTLFITDLFAALFAIAVPLAPRVPARTRLAVGIALVVLNPLVNLADPASSAGVLARELLCGVDPSRTHELLSNYGILPITGYFLVGSWFGERFARAPDHDAFARWLLSCAFRLVALGGALVAFWLAAKRAGLGLAARALYPDYETTLYPIYLASTLAVIAVATRIDPSRPAARALALIGKTSLFLYVAQYYFVETIPELIGIDAMAPHQWLEQCVITFALLVGLGAVWNRYVKRA